MDKTPVDWEELEAQAVLIQRLISDHETSLDSPHFISRVAQPDGLINVDSPFHDLPVSSCHVETLTIKGRNNFTLRSPLKNVTNSGIDGTPEKPNQENLPISCPTSAEFKEFLLKISEVSPGSNDSSCDIRLDGSKDDSSGYKEKAHIRRGTFDIEDSDIKKAESNKTTRGRLGTYNLTPPSPLLSSGLKDSGEDGLVKTTNSNVIEESKFNNVQSMKPLVPSISSICSLDDSDLSSSDESVEETETEEDIPATELLIVLDEVPSVKSSVKNKKSRKLTDLKIQSNVLKDVPQNTNENCTKKETKTLDQEESDIVKGIETKLNTETVSVNHIEKIDLPTKEDSSFITASTLEKAENVDEVPGILTNVPATNENSSNLTSSKIGSLSSSNSSSSNSMRLIPKTSSHSVVAELKKEQKAPGTVTINKSLIKRSSLGHATQVKVPVNATERRSLGASAPSIKPTLMKPGLLQPKVVAKRSSFGNKTGTPGTEGSIHIAGDSVLSRTVTKSQPTVSKVLQKNSKLEQSQTKENKSPKKGASQASEINQKKVKGTTFSRPSLLPPRPLARGLPVPSKTNLKSATEVNRSVQETTKAAPHLTKPVPEIPKPTSDMSKPAPVQIKAPLTATKTLKLVRPGFTKAPGAKPASNSENFSKAMEKEQDAATVDQKPGAGSEFKLSSLNESNSKGLIQMQKKGPAPIKAIFQPSVSKDAIETLLPDGSKTVTKEQNDVSRVLTKSDQFDGSKTVTKVKPEGEARALTLSSECSLPSTVSICQITPMKTDKPLNPRRLSDVFQNISPESEKQGKQSKIPTPKCSRIASRSSSGSNSSFSSFRKPSDFESPSTVRKESTGSASAFKPKRALVRYTPDVEPRRQSMWSPVKKKLLPDQDMAHQCTKRLRPGQEGSL
ncbi:uncharacterized protein LOC106056527 isoform X1 [Biomphalaria glabrata]|uniref:Uncharacterized protein LOC106056527 isoform X1 n=1 Tax=Biomphalaria glabrata TaxID=6526 RepID=A0A9W3A8Q1_BIOGL|nr:uncharacterized protein LOC106056527 isoform X1 [Biomphalaria glabrata]XP_055883678.1 uncharacterized protein LOC106056527 isoform X1 [Biomphalaria glabrata]